jgi:hypothetical protein
MSQRAGIEANQDSKGREMETLPSPLLRTTLQAAPSTAGRCCSAPRAR